MVYDSIRRTVSLSHVLIKIEISLTDSHHFKHVIISPSPEHGMVGVPPRAPRAIEPSVQAL